MRFETRSKLAVLTLLLCALGQTACSRLSRSEEIAIVAEPLPSKNSPAAPAAGGSPVNELAAKLAQGMPPSQAPGGGG